MDSDHSDNDSQSFMEDLEVENGRNGHSSHFDRLPLIPTDFSSANEAMQNFTAVFESRYGGLHPRFFPGSLKDALNEAFGTNFKTVMEKRPLALYLHNDDAVAANIFAQNVLCGDTMSSLLNCQYVVWPWDVTQVDNSKKCMEWLSECNMSDVRDMVRMESMDEYPLLVLVTKERSTYSVHGICHGFDNPDDCVGKVMSCLDAYQEIKHREQAEERSRLEREQIRQEQHDEYEKSKAVDRARQEEQKRKREEEMAEQRRLVEAEQRKLERQAEIASRLPAEPAEGAACVTLRLRFPSGETKVRRFGRGDQLRWLLAYVESLGFDMADHRIWNSDFPRRDVTTLDTAKTFAELGWPAREQVTVEEK